MGSLSAAQPLAQTGEKRIGTGTSGPVNDGGHDVVQSITREVSTGEFLGNLILYTIGGAILGWLCLPFALYIAAIAIYALCLGISVIVSWLMVQMLDLSLFAWQVSKR